MEQFREVFRAEAADLLTGVEQALVAAEGASDPNVVRDVFRAIHTLKGNASLLGFPRAAQLAHAAEDLLDALSAGDAPLTTELSTLLLRTVDALRAEIVLGREGQRAPDAEADPDDLGRKLLAAAKALAASEDAAPSPPNEQNEATSDERLAEATARREPERTLRIELGRLDRMLDLIGEITIARGRLATLLEELRGAPRQTKEALLAAHRQADGLHLELQELLMQARMVRIERAFRPLARRMRDLCAATGKHVRLETFGDDVEVDASIVEHLKDPLTHLVRNAVDHGIEAPEIRRERGKPPTGLVSLRAAREAGTLVVEVSDDGRGLDRERIEARARALGLLREGEQAPDGRLFDLVFVPGLTTAGRVTELSGRGIGMDVVKRNVEALRGSVSVRSVEGAGCSVTMRLPLSLSILDGFSVGVGADVFILPLESVVECVEHEEDARGARSAGVINLRGHPLPYLRLRDLFAAEGPRPARESMVVVTWGGQQAGFVVDALLGHGQTVIKPLGKLFQRIAGISGSAILGNGRVALILDVAGLLERALTKPRPTLADSFASPLSARVSP